MSDDRVCVRCGSRRPVDGWVRVTELVVHGRFEEEEALKGGATPVPTPVPRPPVHRTVYLEAPGSPSPDETQGSHTVGLAATFVTSFLITTFLVLALYTSSRNDASASSGEVAAAKPTVVDTIERRPRGRNGNLGATRQTAPLETEASPPESESELEPPPEFPPIQAAAPPVATALDGEYAGTIDATPVTMILRFEGGGVVDARIRVEGGAWTEATGTYGLEDSTAELLLEDRGAENVTAYSGKVFPTGSLLGQTTASTGRVRYLQAQRRR